MQLRVVSVKDVAERQLCCGCGACAYMSPSSVEMIDALDHGRRPRVTTQAPQNGQLAEALKVCPGVGLEHDRELKRTPALIRELLSDWGPVVEVWEGYSSSADIRFAGSSGGAATTLALYCLEQLGMHGVLHIAARHDVPYLNQTVLSTSRAELLERTGSRYAPASPCDGLQLVEDAPRPCVFIGKPCDVAAVQNARKLRPGLDAKIGLTIAFFCAGTPTTRGTLEMLGRMGIDDPAKLVSLRYRGRGWPGRATATVRTEKGVEQRELSYEESWGEVLANHKQWRCKICPDHSGEFADIAVGDPWYRRIEPGEAGRSLILARSEHGQRVLRDAIDSGYLVARIADPSVVSASQPSLVKARGAVWARLLTLRLLGLPVPRFKGFGFAMFHCWLARLSLNEKFRSIFGTIRRAVKERLRQRVRIEPFEEPESNSQWHESAPVGMGDRM